MKSFKNIEGIIFKVSNAGAFDKVVNIINKKGEREVAFAKGIKKAGSKKSYAVELGNFVKVKAITGYGMPIMTDINLVKENLNWKKDFKITFYLQMLCEVIDKFCVEGQEEIGLYKALDEVLSISDFSNSNLSFITGIFMLKAISASGNLPEKFHDSDIMINDSDANKEDLRIFKTQKFCIEKPVQTALRVNLTENEKAIFFRQTIFFIEDIIGSELKSKKVVLGL